MNRKTVATAIAAAAMHVCGAAVAQSPAAAYPPPPGTAPASPGPGERQTHAVLRITSVEIIRSSREPYLNIVRARGLVSSSGWQEVELVPLTRGQPPDGILRLVMVAQPPQPAADATGYEPVEAIFPLAPSSPFKGVNVHGATNGVVVGTMPGYAEGKAAPDDCGTCVGKTFVPRGGVAPAGRTGIVREDQLPPITRVVAATGGLMGLESNPNRLTLLLNGDNLIVGAVWD